MNYLLIVSIVGAVFALSSVIFLFVLLHSSTRAKVLRGVLVYREFGTKNAKSRERFERETVKMTFNVEVEVDKKTLTIDAEGNSEDVRHVTGVLTEILGANADQVITGRPELEIGDTHRMRSRFAVVRRSDRKQETSLEAASRFVILDEDVTGSHQ